MARKKESSQKTAMREMMCSYFKENNISIKNGTDVNAILRDMMSVILEDAPNNEIQNRVFNGCQPFKNAVPSNDGHYKEMDETPSEPRADPFPTRDLF